jgi:hypothetical protein
MLRSQSSRRSNQLSAKKWCFCIDFRAGTIVLAVFQIAVHLLCMGFLMLLVVRPTLVHEIIGHFHSDHHNSLTHDTPNSIKSVASVGHPSPQYSLSPTFHMLIFGRQQTWIVKDKDGKTHAVVLHQISKPLLLPMDGSNVIPSGNKFPFGIPSRSRRNAEPNPAPSKIEALPFPGNVRAEPLTGESKLSLNIKPEKASESNHYHFGCHHKRHHMLALICLWISLCFSCSLLYGAAMRRPMFMVPYLVIQLVCFFFFLVGLLHTYSYLPYIKEWIAHKDHLPLRRTLLKMSELQLSLVFLAASWSVLLLKLNLLALVWGCYRMLRMEQLRERIVRRQAIDALRTHADGDDGAVKVVIDVPALVFLDEGEKNGEVVKNDKEQPPPYKPEKEAAMTDEKEEDALLMEA